MHLDKFDQAEGWLRSALQRDPLHAIPYVNLGIIVAIRKQEAVSRGQFVKAVNLGYSPVSAQQLLARALARGEDALNAEK